MSSMLLATSNPYSEMLHEGGGEEEDSVSTHTLVKSSRRMCSRVHKDDGIAGRQWSIGSSEKLQHFWSIVGMHERGGNDTDGAHFRRSTTQRGASSARDIIDHEYIAMLW